MLKRTMTAIILLTVVFFTANIQAQKLPGLLDFYQQAYTKLDNGMLKTFVTLDGETTMVLLDEETGQEGNLNLAWTYTIIAELPLDSPHMNSINKLIAETELDLGGVFTLTDDQGVMIVFKNSFWIDSIENRQFANELLYAHYNTLNLQAVFEDYVGLE